MSKFRYKARDENGKEIVGQIDGTNIDQIVDLLGEKKLIPITIDELNFDGSKKDETFWEKVNAGLH